ncbi:MAG: glutamate racemase [Clostridiales bacterium]|nr:glutamate racemase [Clostridiales bacterium]
MRDFIGVFDSGMGGVTVLADLAKSLPNENFIYIGDSLNAPYGEKEQQRIYELSEGAVEDFISRGAKLIVIACNTATSAAISALREKYETPIVGMEPAIKPALIDNNGGDIAVMATPMTLKLDKFNTLLDRLKGKGKVLKIPAPKLVKLVESGYIEGPGVEDYINELFEGYDKTKIESIVLGCTHFLYLKKVLMKVFDNKVKIYDGNKGTVNRVIQILSEKNIFNVSSEKGNIIIENSLSEKMAEQSFEMLTQFMKLEE